jgi:hypothetical protein
VEGSVAYVKILFQNLPGTEEIKNLSQDCW